ncbi:hypothetical protein DPMN_095939 [Dreissena polymorpha]|uniref:Uncharacterized protein n=1 Tax=Dreissena polymorpha TaxID=45954 RepID=A0A9D4L8C4_DREPO|nr:hypothetical protein DPMN_095939 [Dreissena polymorpha]
MKYDFYIFDPAQPNFELGRYFIGTKLLIKFHEDRTRNQMFTDGRTDRHTTDKDRSKKAHLSNQFQLDRKINVPSIKKCPAPGSHVFQPTVIIFELFQDIIGMNLLTKFHEDRTVNVASRVLTRLYYSHIRKIAPPLGSHVFQAIIIIFELIQDIIVTNILTKFHEDLTTINVASREKCPAPGDHVCKATKTIFELIQDIIGKNLLTKFHDDRKINVASRKNAPPRGGHVFQATGIIFELIQDIIGMNLLTKFHEDETINVASSVKNAPPLGSHVFQANEKCPAPGGHVCKATKTIFELIQDIIGKNLLTKFHDDRKINVASKKNAPPRGGHVFQTTGIIFELVEDFIGINLLTEFHEDRTINVASTVKNAPPLGSHVFQANITIFELIQDINKTNLLTIFHDDWTINVASRVLTMKNAPPPGGNFFPTKGHHFLTYWTINVASRLHIRKNAPPPWQPYIIGTNLLTKCHEDRKINVASRENFPPTGGHVFQPTGIIFELAQDIIRINLLTKFHEDWTINVASRVLTRFYYSHNVTIFKLIQDISVANLLSKFHEDRKINMVFRENAPPPGGHVFQTTGIIFELVQDIIGMNLLTKFHEDETINVASSVKNTPPLGSHVFQANVTIFELIQDIIDQIS